MAALWAMTTARTAFRWPMPMADLNGKGTSPPPRGEGMGVGGSLQELPASSHPAPPPHPSPTTGGESREHSGGGVDADPALHRLRLTQILSPAFPIGAFAHSQGLEWAIATGRVPGGAALQDWIKAVITRGSGHSDAVFLSLARRPDADLAALAELYAAFLSSAGRALEAAELGRGFATLTDCWKEPLPYVLALGRETAPMNVPEAELLALFLQSLAAQLVSVAVRFMPLGQTEGQRILAALGPLIVETARACTGATEDVLWTFTPGADIAAMAQGQMETRIFRS
jgi:urease accessory protein